MSHCGWLGGRPEFIQAPAKSLPKPYDHHDIMLTSSHLFPSEATVTLDRGLGPGPPKRKILEQDGRQREVHKPAGQFFGLAEAAAYKCLSGTFGNAQRKAQDTGRGPQRHQASAEYTATNHPRRGRNWVAVTEFHLSYYRLCWGNHIGYYSRKGALEVHVPSWRYNALFLSLSLSLSLYI